MSFTPGILNSSSNRSQATSVPRHAGVCDQFAAAERGGAARAQMSTPECSGQHTGPKVKKV